MLIVKRLLLLVMVVIVPILLTWISYVGVTLLLARTKRYIDPQVLHLAGYGEYAAFLFIAILDARARWTARPAE